MTTMTRRSLALTIVFLLAACKEKENDRLVYEQTPGSSAAFAFAQAVHRGMRADLPAHARAAGLVEAGVCRELGSDRLYCNALRVTDMGLTQPPGARIYFGMRFEELRLCLAPGQAVGFVSEGGQGGPIPEPLYREYPEEFATLLESDFVEVGTKPEATALGDGTSLASAYSLTDISWAAAAERLGYGGPASPFVEVFPEVPSLARHTARWYPSHAPAEQACRDL